MTKLVILNSVFFANLIALQVNAAIIFSDNAFYQRELEQEIYREDAVIIDPVNSSINNEWEDFKLIKDKCSINNPDPQKYLACLKDQ